jgi:hypothetical protein
MEDLHQQAQESLQTRIQQSPVSNPVKAFISYGLVGALCVLIGGSCFHRKNLHNEIFTTMYGGMVMGGAIGCLGYYIAIVQPEKFHLYNHILQLTAYFTSPIVGLKIYKPFHPRLYFIILLDWLIGSLIVTGGLCVCLCSIFLCCAPCLGFSMFSSGAWNPTNLMSSSSSSEQTPVPPQEQSSLPPDEQPQPLHFQQRNPVAEATFAKPMEVSILQEEDILATTVYVEEAHVKILD